MSIKMLREALCREQVNQGEWPIDVQLHVRRLIKLVDQHRPLDASGKHGNLHTETCGCTDQVNTTSWR